jgi:hypothetical protein
MKIWHQSAISGNGEIIAKWRISAAVGCASRTARHARRLRHSRRAMAENGGITLSGVAKSVAASSRQLGVIARISLISGIAHGIGDGHHAC